MRSLNVGLLVCVGTVGVIAACGGSSGDPTSKPSTTTGEEADAGTGAAPTASTTSTAKADSGTSTAPTATTTAHPTPTATSTGTGGGGGVPAWNSVVGSFGFFSQTFNGETWSARTLTTGSINAISCVGNTVGWAAGEGGWIGHTKDSGASWQPETSFTAAKLNGIKFSTTTHGIVAGDGGAIGFTNDGGDSWTAASSGVGVSLRGVALGYGQAFAVGDQATALRSTDNGVTWASTTVPGAADFVSVATDDTAGIVLAADSTGAVFQSTDHGASFAKAFTASGALGAVAIARDATHALAVGAGGAAFVRDAQGTWSTITTGTRFDLHAALVADNGTHFLVAGAGGVLLDSADFGATWTPHPLGTTVTLLGLDDATW
jgi:photosystem II stability/assembly factor-like uncharacterized protein